MTLELTHTLCLSTDNNTKFLKKGGGVEKEKTFCACSMPVNELGGFMIFVVLWYGSTRRLNCQYFWFKTSQKMGPQLKVSSDRQMEQAIEHRINWQQWKSRRRLSKVPT